MTTGTEAILALGKRLYGEKFELKENLIEPYRKVFFNFTSGLIEDNREKGLGLIGGKGLSKTSIMRIMHILFKDTPRKFKWVTSKRLIFMMEDFKVSEIMEMYADCKCDLYIDDIGLSKNEETKKWGNSVNLIAEILQARYELFIDFNFKTHWSSNMPTDINRDAIIKSAASEELKHQLLNTTTLSDIYGERLVDRMKEMNQLIKFKGESLR